MNKTEMVAAIAEKTGLTKKDAEAAFKATFDVIAEQLMQNQRVQISGFGVFEVKRREARVGRNPHTKREIMIPASLQPAFKASKALKQKVAE